MGNCGPVAAMAHAASDAVGVLRNYPTRLDK